MRKRRRRGRNERERDEEVRRDFAGATSERSLRSAALAGFAAFAGLLLPGAAFAQGQDKSAPLSQVQRLNRAPVNKDVLRVQLPRPTVVKLKNGLTIVLEEDHKLPTVAFTMWIRPGQLADPSDLPGLASFTAGMLREGTEKRTSEQIASEVDSLGASLDASSRFGVSYTSVNASGLITDTAKILDLMSDVVLHPSFPASELAKYKQSEGASLEQRLANPGVSGAAGIPAGDLRRYADGAGVRDERIDRENQRGGFEAFPREALRAGKHDFGRDGRLHGQ